MPEPIKARLFKEMIRQCRLCIGIPNDEDALRLAHSKY